MNQSTLVFAALATLLLSGGCGLFGQQQLEQCRGESDRLLAEYRTERDARQRFEIQNRALVDRVADLEQRLAVIGDVADPRLATRSGRDSAAAAAPPLASAPPASGTSSPAPASASPSVTTPADVTSSKALAPDAGSAGGLANPAHEGAPDPWRAVPRPRRP